MTTPAIKRTLAPLALWLAAAVADHEAKEVIDEAAWDAADEGAAYRGDGQAHR